MLDRVTEESTWWPKADFRNRQWMPPDEAARRVDETELKEMIAKLPERV